MIPLHRRAMRGAVRRWANALRIADPWDALARELDRHPAGSARFWWRDDDAITQTDALDRLLLTRASIDLPLALAVIPASADAGLAAAIAGHPDVHVLTHGWDHHDHAAPGQQPSELAAGRASDTVRAQLAAGKARVRLLFGSRALAVLVPPFNHLAASHHRAVAAAGFRYVSADRDFLGLPLPSRNIHVDVIDWQAHTAISAVVAVRPLIVALRLRRYGLVPSSEPIGIMTHHLVHDAAIWALTESLLRRIAGHPAASFPAIPALFPEPPPDAAAR
jgi:peptidoglycan/xylan/chitin deacetylase (PgdA/CDA1 family)